MSSVIKEHCTGCRTLKRVRKDEKIGEHTHPVTGERCPGVDNLSMERTPLTRGLLYEQLREVARAVTASRAWEQETTAVLMLEQLLAPRIERMEQEVRELTAEHTVLVDTVMAADELLEGNYPAGSSIKAAAEEAVSQVVQELRQKYPRLRD